MWICIVSLNCVHTISNHETESIKRAKARCNYSSWDSWTPPGRGPLSFKSWKNLQLSAPAQSWCGSLCSLSYGCGISLTALPLLPWLSSGCSILTCLTTEVMGTVCVVIVGIMCAAWIFFVAMIICCHVHQLRERNRLRRVHASYFRQWRG